MGVDEREKSESNERSVRKVRRKREKLLYWEVNYWGLCRGAKLLVSCNVLSRINFFNANFHVYARLRKPLPISSVGLSSKYIKFTLLVHSRWSS